LPIDDVSKYTVRAAKTQKLVHRKSKRKMPHSLSVQPSGNFILANYFGAINKHIDCRRSPTPSAFIHADYLRLTTVRTPRNARSTVQGVALD